MGTWSGLSNQPSFNAEQMLLLTDGTVMCHEFQTNRWHRLTPDANGSYVNGSWSDIQSMPDNSSIPSSSGGPTNAPTFFASAVFADGTVFVAGGEYNGTSTTSNDILTAQIYDPVADSWSIIANPPGFTGVGDAVSCVLADGRLLLGQFNGSATVLFDPNTQIYQAGGTKGDSCSEETFTLLPNGNVLTVQCSNSPNAEQYIPSSNTWVNAGATGVTLPQACTGFVAEIGPAILLPDGRVFAIGATGNTALYTPDPDPTKAGTWANGPSLADSGGNTQFPMDAPAALLPNGKVLLAGSPSNPCKYPGPTNFFEFDPSANTAATITNPSNNGNAVFTGRLLLVPTGQVLFSNNSNSIQVYTPDGNPQNSWKPVITGFPATLITEHVHTISGRQFNGLSQACSYGDDAQQATNYPIVRLSNSSGDVVYLRTSHHSTMGVATGSATVTTNVFVSSSVPTGPWNMVVVANGIASDPVSVTVGTRDCFFLVDRSTYAQGEIQALITLNGTPAVIDEALFVVVEGFSRDQIGAAVPSIPDPVTKVSFQSSGPAIPQDPSLPSSAIQRFTFPFRAVFQDASMFGSSAQTPTVNATFNADGSSVGASAQIELLNTPNPFILHGDVANGKPWYLSVDLRVFQVRENDRKFAVTLNPGAAKTVAPAFISQVIANLNVDPGPLGPAFDALPQEEDSAALTLAPSDAGGTPVYNFALARVRYRDVQVAHTVRTFFRMWPAQQTNATYDTNTTYRSFTSGTQKIPLLGVSGNEILTIPFFATPRVSINASLTTQTDTPNVHDINFDPLGGEVDAYFGCWLDINQPGDAIYPPRLVGGNPADIPDGPFAGFNPLVSIQQLVRSQHQCLIAEVAFDPDPIPSNADPSTSDKLAQRNLAFVNVPNPGVDPSRIAPQAFEIRRSPVVLHDDNRPDELMIRWGSTPTSSTATFFLPEADAADVLDWAGKLYTTHSIVMVDAHTIQVPASGVTFIPIPQGAGPNFVGLLSVNLPRGITKGQKFDVLVRQVTSEQHDEIIIGVKREAASSFTWRRTLGVFQLTIPISVKQLLLGPEERWLSVLRYIGDSIPAGTRWSPVMTRLVDQTAGRVKGLGGDPDQVKPSPTGDWYVPSDGHGGLVVTFVGEHGQPIDAVVDVSLQHKELSDRREIRNWPTLQILEVHELIATHTGIYELQAIGEHGLAGGRFVTISEEKVTKVRLELKKDDDDKKWKW